MRFASSHVSMRACAALLTVSSLVHGGCDADEPDAHGTALRIGVGCDDAPDDARPPAIDGGARDAADPASTGHEGSAAGDAGAGSDDAGRGGIDSGPAHGGEGPFPVASGVTIEAVETRGCGGAAGGVEVSIAEDGSNFQVVFGGFRADVKQRTSCQISVLFTPPRGFRARFASLMVDGTVQVSEGVSAELQGVQFFSGRQTVATFQPLSFSGPRQEAFSARLDARAAGEMGEDCGEEEITVDLLAAYPTRSGADGPEPLRLDDAAAIDVRRIHAARFELKPCERR